MTTDDGWHPGAPGFPRREMMSDELAQRRKERISMAREICLYRGENPDTIDRGGNAGWEKYEPLAGAAIREAERLFAMRNPAASALPGTEMREATAWRVWWVSLNTARTELFEDLDKASIKARETGGCVIPLYTALSPAGQTNSSFDKNAERCPRCNRTDAEHLVSDVSCANPWHGDDHLRAKSSSHSRPECK